MNVLVTGGAGFIGSHLVDRLMLSKCRVTVLDNYDPFYDEWYKRDNLSRWNSNPSLRIVEHDLASDGGLDSVLGNDYDVIVHLAARAGVRPSIVDPVSYQQVNVNGTQKLLEFAKQRKIGQFVFASSSSVYGINPAVPWDESDHILQPISPYASSKISGELLGHVYHHLYGIRFLALRFFTVYGPRQRPDLAFRKFAERIIAGEPIPVYGDGSTSRDYTYVADIVDGVVAAMNYTGSGYEVINLGNGSPVTLKEVIGLLEEALGRKAKRDVLPMQPGDVPRTWASIEKAKRLLGYAPSTPLVEGLREFAAWLEMQHNLAKSSRI